MNKLQVLPEETISLQVLEPITKTGAPVIKATHITENGVYSAKKEGAIGFDPVEVAVDLTPAYDAGYRNGEKAGYIKGYGEGKTDAETNAIALVNEGIAGSGAQVEEADSIDQIPNKIQDVYGFGRIEGYQFGEKEGYKKGKTDGEDNALDAFNLNLQGTGIEYAESVDEIDGKFEEATQQQYDKGVEIGRIEGKQAEYDAFWDAFQQNGTRTDYENAFRVGWDDTNFKPKYDITPVGNCSQTFQNSGITDVKGICEKQGVVFDFSKVTYSNNPFSPSKITRLPLLDISNIPNCTAIFNSVSNLVWVDGVVLNENGTQTFGTGVGYNWTLYSAKLTHFPISGTIGTNCYFNSCNLLDDETIQSIIDALKDLTGQTAQTLTFHRTVGNKLTQAQKDAISAKNWTLAY